MEPKLLRGTRSVEQRNQSLSNTDINPVDVERALLEKANNDVVNENPEEVASMFFTMYLPRFFTQVDTLSNKDLRRLVKALVECPLNDSPYKFHSDTAKEAFVTGLRLLEAKQSMILHVMSEEQNLEQLYQAANSEVDTSLDNKEEVDENGV